MQFLQACRQKASATEPDSAATEVGEVMHRRSVGRTTNAEKVGGLMASGSSGVWRICVRPQKSLQAVGGSWEGR
jgi:uncharacterized membrane protein